MATYSEGTIQQGTYEIRKWTVDFTNDLPSAVTVTGGSAYHTPPSGAAATVTVTASSPYVIAQIGTLSVTGIHYLDVIGTLSNSEISQLRIAFTVNYPTSTARSGMGTIVNSLRGFTDCGPNDFTIGGVPYWSDAQLQEVADRHRTDFRFQMMESKVDYVSSGSISYTEYWIGHGNLEQGTAYLNIEDSAGTNVAGTAYTVDYQRGIVTFVNDQAGTAYYATGRSYNLYGAAAEIWRMKAANSAKMYDFSSDNHNLRRSQFFANCMQMSQHYENMAGPVTIEMVRGDLK